MIHVYCKKIIVSYYRLLFIFLCVMCPTPSTPPPNTIAELWLKYCFSIPQMAVLPSKIIRLPSSGREMCASPCLAYVSYSFVSEEI